MGKIRVGSAASYLGAVEASRDHLSNATIIWLATPSDEMKTESLFSAKMQADGRRAQPIHHVV